MDRHGLTSVVEAPLDRGRRGIAVPHRRAILGRWYVSMLTRHDRPAPPKPVIIGAPTPAALTMIDREPLEGSLLAELGWRCIVLSGLAALAWWVT
jgi:hypothetical protein